MYVCLCNGLTDRDLSRCVGQSARQVSDVYRALGCAPRCGKCVPYVVTMLDEAEASRIGPGLG